jgi:hypothetical protein
MITLRPYQTDAAKRLTTILLTHHVAYLRGEVRTGKTLTAFETARLMEMIKMLDTTKVLVVTKKKAIASIQRDAEAIGVQATVTRPTASVPTPSHPSGSRTSGSCTTGTCC